MAGYQALSQNGQGAYKHVHVDLEYSAVNWILSKVKTTCGDTM